MSEKITVQRDNKSNLSFIGNSLGSASSFDNNDQSDRWTELELYESVAGSYVCSEICRTIHDGERDRFRASVRSDTVGVIEFFGHRWLAQELYSNSGIEDVETIE